MSRKLNKSNIINYAGSLVALIIGSGYATGQEIMQYFASYGGWGFAGAALTGLILGFTALFGFTRGHTEHYSSQNLIYEDVAGPIVGKFFDYFSVIAVYLVFMVMLGGAQATLAQQYDLTGLSGGFIFTLIVMVTVFFGLSSIVEVIGKIGPFLIVLTISVGLLSIILNIHKLDTAFETLKVFQQNNDILIASSNWFSATLAYTGENAILIVAFVTSLGKHTDNIKELRWGGSMGIFAFVLALSISALAIILSYPEVATSQIPTLDLANQIHPVVQWIYSISIILAIYTSAVGFLWTVAARFFREGTKGYQIATVLLSLLGFFISTNFEFSVLLNIVYTITGYIGIIFIFLALLKALRERINLWSAVK